jgi:hypothetical protein
LVRGEVIRFRSNRASRLFAFTGGLANHHTSRVPALLQQYGVDAAVGSSFGVYDLPAGLATVIGHRSSEQSPRSRTGLPSSADDSLGWFFWGSLIARSRHK